MGVTMNEKVLPLVSQLGGVVGTMQAGNITAQATWVLPQGTF